MWGVIAFLCGVGCGAIGSGLLVWIHLSDRDRLPRPALPPARARAIRRAQLANRLDLKPALGDRRHWIAGARDSFDFDEETR